MLSLLTPERKKAKDGPTSQNVREGENGAPEEPNVYSDGSLKQNKSYFWQTGGAGVFWPRRKPEELTDYEKTYTEQEQLEEGLLLWCTFNSLLNSSIWIELVAAILAMIPGRPVHIGIDNAAVVNTRQPDHKVLRRQGECDVEGKTARLHRRTPPSKDHGTLQNMVICGSCSPRQWRKEGRTTRRSPR